MKQINPQLLREWKKEGELLAIWRCEKCFMKIPLYKTNSPLVNSIYLSFASHEKYCLKCRKNKSKIKKRNPGSNPSRELILLRRYEGVVIEKRISYLNISEEE